MALENVRRKRGRPKVADPKASQVRAKIAYNARQRDLKAYMAQVTEAAERLNEAAQNAPAQMVLPLSELVTDSTPVTLNNIAAFIEAENARTSARGKRKKQAR